MNVDNHAQPSSTGQPATLKEIMRSLYKTGLDGLPIATEPPDLDPQVAAATVAMLRKVSSNTQEQLGMAELDEATIRSRDGARLACRCLAAGGQDMILIAIVPPGRYYRRATSRAIRQIKQLLS